MVVAASGCATEPPVPSPLPVAASPTYTVLDAQTVGDGRPQAGDEVVAAQLAMRYEDAIAKRDWDAAWALLAPEYRASSPGRAEFETERSQFVNSTRGQYVVARPTHDGPEIRQWVTTRGSVIPVSPNYDRAFLARVDFPALSGNNAGWEELLVAPLADGTWFIWVLR